MAAIPIKSIASAIYGLTNKKNIKSTKIQTIVVLLPYLEFICLFHSVKT